MLMYWIGLAIFVIFNFPFFESNNFWGVYLVIGSVCITMIFFLIVWLKDSGKF